MTTLKQMFCTIKAFSCLYVFTYRRFDRSLKLLVAVALFLESSNSFRAFGKESVWRLLLNICRTAEAAMLKTLLKKLGLDRIRQSRTGYARI